MIEFINLLVGVLVLIGFGVLYGKLMNYFGKCIQRFIQIIKSNIVKK